ncbi:kelch-like protein 24 [Ptychodera flava]|uniref:kelch-like protein 24 n=1 Tax=Ptychodera flava TaxID=63121 RepID=UPI00396A8874
MASSILSAEWKYSNPNHAGAVLGKLNELRLQAFSTDVVLCISEKQFPCHQVVLASCCNFFMGFFYEKTQSQETAAMMLEDINTDLFELFLEYLYTGSAKLTAQNIDDVLKIAERFEVDSLVQGCKEYMQKEDTDSQRSKPAKNAMQLFSEVGGSAVPSSECDLSEKSKERKDKEDNSLNQMVERRHRRLCYQTVKRLLQMVKRIQVRCARNRKRD